MWIGGFILGGSLLFRGFNQWSEIEKMDAPTPKERKIVSPLMTEDDKHMVITCGSCFEKIRLLKGQGATKVQCPKCSTERIVYT